MKHAPPTALIILDGFGYTQEKEGNAVARAKKPNLDTWLKKYPHALLSAHGKSVGLLPGTVGNSEVGHLTIGSGRTIKQPLTVMHEVINDKTFFNNAKLITLLRKLKKPQKKLHLLGLLSDGGVHSHIDHLFAFLRLAAKQELPHIIVHPFLDGRDTAPQSAAVYLEQLDHYLKKIIKRGSIGSIHGRFYAMDRNQNWPRTQASYAVLTQQQENKPISWHNVLENNYAQGITDEFIPPTQLEPRCIIEPGDGIIFFNVRQERARQLTAAFVQQGFDHFDVQHIDLSFFITPTDYGTLPTTVLYPKTPVPNTLIEVLNEYHKQIFTIAETEKYAHVTYFFNGGNQEQFPHEHRILIPSIRAKGYVHAPAMSAHGITKAVLDSLQTAPDDFYLINYANADMVAHAGDMLATARAIECLDTELGKIYHQLVEKMDGTMYITADHGNAEKQFADTTQAITAHTTSPVPFLMLKKGATKKDSLPLNKLSDIAPFILENMGLPVPDEMKRS